MADFKGLLSGYGFLINQHVSSLKEKKEIKPENNIMFKYGDMLPNLLGK